MRSLSKFSYRWALYPVRKMRTVVIDESVRDAISRFIGTTRMDGIQSGALIGRQVHSSIHFEI